ncbi:uncharacterized protein EI97DRAFT_156451 [Westerdykella ornata]|uniref:alpha-galactosidase n=1 Tax=Westerdykella ornata TaxID=318751 RepID=A0A6A6JCQ3_WESOR|nr:uncharacterized protein EI97DRAFT_156451 [Westerdykella ornata]KAF2273406.1 hypothetical protein EI97DRAFT_156451 [Westerdykella ornata]
MATEYKPRKPAWSLRRKLLLIALPLVLVIGLALGLGLGLTLGRDHNDDDSDGDNNGPEPPSTTSPPPSPPPTNGTAWKPAVNSTWQIVLQGAISVPQDAKSVTPDVSIFDIDLFDTSKDTIDTLHRLGKKVICYFSAGTFEPRRPDSGQFKGQDIGKALQDWPDEKWLRLGSEDVRRIMKGRVELAREKGCDGIDPDNVDGYQNDNGLDLTKDDSISFVSYLSNISAQHNLAMGLKNAGDIIPQVLDMVDFSVNEQCVQYAECGTFKPFIDAGKPVFHIEYPDNAGTELGTNTVLHYCGNDGDAEGREGFSTVLKKMDLDGWVEFCDQKVAVTAT